MRSAKTIWRILVVLPIIALSCLVFFVVLSERGLIADGPYNPSSDYQLGAPLRGFNHLKLAHALRNPDSCQRVLSREAGIKLTGDWFKGGDSNCGILNGVTLGTVHGIDYGGLNTRCDTALRLMAWVNYDVVPMANERGLRVVKMDHQGSYACRNMRTSTGANRAPSQHSFAKAVDIAGMRFDDGTRLELIADWDAVGADAWRGEFLRAIRDDACNWFNGVLSPDYNALHADHFHFDLSKGRFCR